MSNFLAVDTSSRYLTVAACKGEKRVVKYVEDCAMQHSVVLMDEIESALTEAGLTPAECDFFAAVTGPGSFTGIRIGISCIKGYAVALGKRAAGVTTFDMLSYNVNSGCDYLVAIDALHGNYYVCGYAADGSCDLPPRYVSAEELIALGRPVYGTEELDLPLYTKFSPEKCLVPAVLAAKMKGGGEPTALYVKKSQAEEEREKRIHGL
ncbi:MAG: tRNA (adenosine(37)-N6)-threonylcarbamoyltransferase complex dimerization subunit type 1 TsaB [Clostridiales bacterium]|nr:tRNA (adenosine(37)-N6)-threonylcarbamoyltransferase complex dimerization subunit type 1 TsaB [Clostridiales bacterium]